LNDSALGVAPSPRQVAKYAERVTGVAVPPAPPKGDGMRSRPQTGYYRLQTRRLCAIIDAGPAGPPFLLAHAHSDMLSFELSVDGRRAIVDSGVFDYEVGEMRRYCRSTVAHNTVSVDGTDACECWGNFRVTRRPRRVEAEWTNTNGPLALTTWHDGFEPRLGVLHRRTFVLLPRDVLLIVDRVAGRGRHRLTSRLHFSPDCEIAADVKQSRLTAALEGSGFGVRWTRWPVTAAVEPSWYCPEFGVRERNLAIVFDALVELPFVTATWIGNTDMASVELTDTGARLTLDGRTYFVQAEEGTATCES